ncbi:hypothetical protein [Ignatzschineria sp. LJL83]
MDSKNYRLLGFELKLAEDVLPSVDCCIWDDDEIGTEKLCALGAQRNMVQLMDSEWDLIENSTKEGSVAMAVLIDMKYLPMLRILDSQYALSPYPEIDFDALLARSWEFRGFDIVDVDGLFSIFDMLPSFRRQELLSVEDDLDHYVELANTAVPSHSPFAPLAIFTYQSR